MEVMRRCGRKLSGIAALLKESIVNGMTTYELDMIAADIFKDCGLKPAFLNYGIPPFKGRICVSINDEIVHGLPSKKKKIKNGDIVSVDLGGVLEGFHSDMAFTVGIGRINSKAKNLIDTTRRALEAGISRMHAGNRLSDVSSSIQEVAEESGYSVVRDLVGHGIGKKLHEHPQVPNYGRKGSGPLLKPGMVFALEPMLNEGSHDIKTDNDSWTVRTLDGTLSCHFENTVAVTESGPEKITDLLGKFYE